MGIPYYLQTSRAANDTGSWIASTMKIFSFIVFIMIALLVAASPTLGQASGSRKLLAPAPAPSPRRAPAQAPGSGGLSPDLQAQQGPSAQQAASDPQISAAAPSVLDNPGLAILQSTSNPVG